MLIMYLMHRRNKNKGAEVWVQKDVGAVDLTPWKYSKIVSVIVIVCVLLVSTPRMTFPAFIFLPHFSCQRNFRRPR